MEPREFGCLGFIIVMILIVLCHKCNSNLNSSNSSETTSEINSEKDNYFEARALFERATEMRAFRVVSTFRESSGNENYFE